MSPVKLCGMTANVKIDLSSNIGISLAIAATSGFLVGYLTSRCISKVSPAQDVPGLQAAGKSDDVCEPETPRSTTPSSTTEVLSENGHHHYNESVRANGNAPDSAGVLKLVIVVRDDLHLVSRQELDIPA